MPIQLQVEPGAHPVGTRFRCCWWCGYKVRAGTVAGPIGTLVGGAIGAVVGGLAGKGVAEAVNPTEKKHIGVA